MGIKDILFFNHADTFLHYMVFIPHRMDINIPTSLYVFLAVLVIKYIAFDLFPSNL